MTIISRVLCLWLSLLPFCFCTINESPFAINYDEAVNRKFIETNGKMRSINDIIGNVGEINELKKSDIHSIANSLIEPEGYIIRDPIGSNLDAKLAGSRYIHRTYYPRATFEELISRHSVLYLSGKTVKDGKSVTLANFYERIIADDPSLWPVLVDTKSIIGNMPDINEESLINNIIPEKFQRLFKFVLENNPKRIHLLFDNIDNMKQEQLDGFINLIDKLSKKRVYITMTGRADLVPQFERIKFSVGELGVFHINEISRQGKIDYLYNYWEKHIPNEPSYTGRLNEYVEAVMSLPVVKNTRTFLTLEVVAEYLTRKQIALNSGKVLDIGCLDYVIDQRPLPSFTLSSILRDVPIGIDLYDKIVNKLLHQATDFNIHESKNVFYEYIGDIAASQTVYQYQLRDNVAPNAVIDEFLRATGFFYHERLMDPTFLDYFAANHVIKEINSGHYNGAAKAFRAHGFRSLVDFINCAAGNIESTHFMSIVYPDHKLQGNMIDKFVLNKHENLFDLVARNLINDPHDITSLMEFMKGDPSKMGIRKNPIKYLVKHNMIQLSTWIEFPFKQLTTSERFTMFKGLVDGVETLSDFHKLEKILSDNYLTDMGMKQRFQMASTLEKRLLQCQDIAKNTRMKILSSIRWKKVVISPENGVSNNRYVNQDPPSMVENTMTANNNNDETFKDAMKKGINVDEVQKPTRFRSARNKFWATVSNLAQRLKLTRVDSSDKSNFESVPLQCLTTRSKRAIPSPVTCHYGWTDVDEFNDAPESRKNEIRVNSDKFLQALLKAEQENPMKARQLVDLLDHLEHKSTAGILTGDSKMLVKDIIREKGFAAYRQKQRIQELVGNNLQVSSSKKSAFSLYSKNVVLGAASVIPFIQGFYGTITTCLVKTNGTNKNCLLASSALAVSGLGMVPGLINPKYVSLALEKTSTTILKMLPLKTSFAVRHSIRSLQRVSIASAGKALHTVGVALTVASLGFDMYNIVEMSRMIDKCSQIGESCLSKDKMNYIISLTFSCVSISVTTAFIITGASFGVGVIVGLAILFLQSLATGMNEVVYYSNKYHTTFGENVGIFFHSIVWKPPPVSVQEYIQRKDWIDQLEKSIIHVLDRNENIIAYATGIGGFSDGNLIAATSFINMGIADDRHGSNLSRALPDTMDNKILLCLPKRNKKASWEVAPKFVQSAVHECRNSFVIANKNWKNRTDENTQILYDLEYIKDGRIMGSPVKNNLFLIGRGEKSLTIIGGIGNVTNNFAIQNELFQGQIVLNNRSPSNILDLSSVNSPIVQFIWSNSLRMARVEFNNNDFFTAMSTDELSPNLHVIGRTGKADIITCNYRREHDKFHNHRSITVDSGGGQSSSNMDLVTDCSVSVVRPFTRIVGNNSRNTTYTAQVWLNDAAQWSTGTVYSTIEPQKSLFMIMFVHRPLFYRLDSVTYDAGMKTLTWILRSGIDSRLSLSIVPYRTDSNATQRVDMTMDRIATDPTNCAFIDSYLGATIVPVIQADNSTSNVQHFNVFSTVNTSRMADVRERYRAVRIEQSNELYIVSKLTNPSTNDTFTFGSSASDRFLIDENTVFLFGGNGPDVYVLNSQSPFFSWINNEAGDEIYDTLIVSDSTCDTLRAKNGSFALDFDEGNEYDLTLYCMSENKAMTRTPRVIIQNYFMESTYRHLQIYWRNALYVVMPPHWFDSEGDYENSKHVELALLVNFKIDEATTLTLTSEEPYIVFNVTNEMKNPLVAYRKSNDVVIARKYLSKRSTLVVVLQEFFSNDSIAKNWLQTRIFKVDGTIEDVTPVVYSSRTIEKLVWSTMNDDMKRKNVDLVQEYFVNVSDTRAIRPIVISHNDAKDGVKKLGVLTLFGAQPTEFLAQWIDNNDTLALCSHQICVHVKNWCNPIHRLQRIELLYTANHRPIVINLTNRTECRGPENIKSLKELNRKFRQAQKRLVLAIDNDNSRLIRCIGPIFAEIMTNNSLFEMFGFGSQLEQWQFMTDNCRALFTSDNLNNMSLRNASRILLKTIIKFLPQSTSKDKIDAQLVENALDKLDNACWRKFTTSLSKLHNEHFNNAVLDVVDETADILHACCA